MGPLRRLLAAGMTESFLTAGTRLGTFRVLRPLGRGGMGAVYLVANVITGEHRALKVILPRYLEDPDARARFVREMKIASSIEHPNVVRVFEPMMDGDTLLLPMELVDGVTLREHLATPLGGARTLSAQEAVALLTRICDGVEEVHARGVIHRDLKPANVMLVREPGGELIPKVLDFGAARHADGSDEHTQAGATLGTPPYMAPEHLAAKRDLDARADVFALGVMAYEMLCGRRPYPVNGAAEIMAKVFAREPFPRPITLTPTLPMALDEAVMRALAFDRDARTPSASAFRDALRDALASPTVTPAPSPTEPLSAELVVERATPAPRPRPLRVAAILGVVAVLLVLSTVLARSDRRDRGAPPRVRVASAVATPAPAIAPRVATPAARDAEVEADDARADELATDAQVAPTVTQRETRAGRRRHRMPRWAR